MGKNNGKHGAKTPIAKWDSLMARTENDIAKKKAEKLKNKAEKKNKNK